MSDERFIKNEMSMRLEQHLSFEQAVDYIAARSGRDQVMGIASRDGQGLFDGHVVAVRGQLHRIEQVEIAAGTVISVRIGESSELLLSREAFEDAARLSMGPEVEALLLDTGGLRVLLQDVLTEPGALV